ncbi:MAG: DUF4062 domain-containing protein [Thermoguttaceae bacterium]|nr:DUF4062 domain-containing protein [Thermoguttaceae bacterium]
MAANRIRVGIYGNTQAGKTHFLYRFLMILKDVCGSTTFSKKCCRGTAATFLDQIEASLEENGRISPTSTYSETDRIIVRFNNAMENNRHKVKFSRDDSGHARYELTFRDLVGERTRDAIDDLSARSNARSNIIMKQINRCDAFLFFLDPTYGMSDPDNQKSATADKINDEHLLKEKKRAEYLIDTVIKVRGNKSLPILFVQTHEDILEKLAPEEQKKAHDWFESINLILHEKYRVLGSVPFGGLKDRDKTQFQISSIQKDPQKTNIVPLIGSMLDLCRECKSVQTKDVGNIVLAVFFVVLMALSIALGIYGYRTVKREGQVALSPVSTTSVLADDMMSELRNIPASWPENRDLRSTMKKSLNLIKQMIKAGEPNEAAVLNALRGAFVSAAKRIEAGMMDDTIPAERRLEIASLLSGVYSTDVREVSPDILDMDSMAKKIDELLRRQLSEEIRASVDRYRQLSPTVSVELYHELVSILKQTQDTISKLNLPFAKSNFALNGEIKNALVLLQGRIKQKDYAVQVWIECSAPAGMMLSLNFTNQQEGKPVYLNEQNKQTSGAEGSLAYVPQANPNTFTFPLDTKVPTLVVSQYNVDKDVWEDFRHSTLLVSDRAACLGELGMPLVFREEVLFRVDLLDKKNKPIMLQLRFQPGYDTLPELLWSTFTTKKENRKDHDAN